MRTKPHKESITRCRHHTINMDWSSQMTHLITVHSSTIYEDRVNIYTSHCQWRRCLTNNSLHNRFKEGNITLIKHVKLTKVETISWSLPWSLHIKTGNILSENCRKWVYIHINTYLHLIEETYTLHMINEDWTSQRKQWPYVQRSHSQCGLDLTKQQLSNKVNIHTSHYPWGPVLTNNSFT